MLSFGVELQVNPGLAASFRIGTVYFGLLLHWRESEGTGTCEVVDFCPFRDDKDVVVAMPGVHLDRQRLECERGYDTELDRRLVRLSTFKIDIEDTRPLGLVTLQQAFVLLKARDGKLFSPSLGMMLHLQGPSASAESCVADGPPPQVLWSADEWRDDKTATTVPFGGDMKAYIDAIEASLTNVVKQREKNHRIEVRSTAVRPRPVVAPAPTAAPKHEESTNIRSDDRRAPRSHAERLSFLPTLGNILLVAAMIGAGWFVLHRAFAPKAAVPVPSVRTKSVTLPIGRPEPSEKDPIVVPTGNSVVTRDQLYTLGFAEHIPNLNRALAAAQNGDLAEFDSSVAWLLEHKPAIPVWPPEANDARQRFNSEMEVLINQARAAGDAEGLKRAVRMSEQYLSSHFGYSTAHLNLALAHIALGPGSSAEAPAFHAVVFKPDSANSYLALAMALARAGKPNVATAAFCAVLRKARFSPKTVALFERIKRGEEFPHPEVISAVRDTTSRCPVATWGVNYPRGAS